MGRLVEGTGEFEGVAAGREEVDRVSGGKRGVNVSAVCHERVLAAEGTLTDEIERKGEKRGKRNRRVASRDCSRSSVIVKQIVTSRRFGDDRLRLSGGEGVEEDGGGVGEKAERMSP